MKGLEELFVIGWMLFGIYLGLFIVILTDLWSGVRKAKKRGEINIYQHDSAELSNILNGEEWTEEDEINYE